MFSKKIIIKHLKIAPEIFLLLLLLFIFQLFFILLYSCHIVRKFLNIDTEHNTQQSQNAEARRR
jgi:hypothetical protein